MNIGVICYPTFGGSGVVATELGIEMAQLGHNVHFITYRQPARLTGIFMPNIFYHEITIYDYPLFDFVPYESIFVSQLVDVIINHKIDIIHVHYAIPFAAIGYMVRQVLARQGIHVPIVTTLHGTDITLLSKDRTFAPVVEFSIDNSSAITAVSEFLKRETQHLFHIGKEIHVIYNFVDIDRFAVAPDERIRKTFAPNGEKIIMHISNFRKVKRVLDVVKIFCKIARAVPAKLLMIGDGPERSIVEEKCRNCPQCKNIILLGKQDKVESLLPIADLFLMPSASESFGLAALEAMAARVPCVTSDAGGLPELNEHGKTGFIAPIGDTDAMTEYALGILQNPTLAHTLGDAAHERAKLFRKERIVPHYVNLYESLL